MLPQFQTQYYYPSPPPLTLHPTSTSNSCTAPPPAPPYSHSAPPPSVPTAPDQPTDDTPKEESLAWTRDWLHPSSSTSLALGHQRPESSALVAEKTCEMICYLWFASSVSSTASGTSTSDDPTKEHVDGQREGGNGGRKTPRPSSIHFTASSPFVGFTRKLLETTQSFALHYIHHLRVRNAGIPPQPGSEFRVCVAGLMMANKFLDDNTYTNATWAAVSLIPLAQINTMERESLMGCGYNLNVSKGVYEDWGQLLRGLVRVGVRAKASAGVVRHRGGRLYPHPSSHISSDHNSSKWYEREREQREEARAEAGA
ncbi:hypothetical protein MVEN_00098000 [Mycena venus]|uniref:Cyclin N-terminal domain-containing protein n=1 Tax=Mycena venus TaxID=2733690 RepID=A0A8H6Z7N8_9AGAR|nr:hypothetical protein MVEN_00098000 [Mycena venus]